MAKISDDGRFNATMSLSDFAASECGRIFDSAGERRKEQYRAAERRSEVFRAWNDVCANTREGRHVTGLHFISERNELVVYTDGASWTQELMMMREIIRARMERAGVVVDAIFVKTSRPGYQKS